MTTVVAVTFARRSDRRAPAWGTRTRRCVRRGSEPGCRRSHIAARPWSPGCERRPRGGTGATWLLLRAEDGRATSAIRDADAARTLVSATLERINAAN